MIADLSKQQQALEKKLHIPGIIRNWRRGKKGKLPPGSLRVCGFLSINVVCIFGGAPPHYCSWGRPNRPGWAQCTVGRDNHHTSQTDRFPLFVTKATQSVSWQTQNKGR